MNAAEIVIREVQGNGRFQMRQLFAKSIREARQSAKLHPHGEVLPLHIGRADMVRVRIARAHLGYNLRDRSVPLIPELAVVSVELGQLSEVGITRKRFFHCFAVEDVGVSGQLHAVISDAIPQILHECLRIQGRAFADDKGRNELAVSIEGHEYPLISEVYGIVFPDVARLLHNKRPNSIALNSLEGKLPHTLIHQLLAALSGQYQQPHDRVAIQAREPFCAANRAPLQKALNRPCREFRLGDHRGPRQLRVRFAEGGFAGIAAPALNLHLMQVIGFLRLRFAEKPVKILLGLKCGSLRALD